MRFTGFPLWVVALPVLVCLLIQPAAGANREKKEPSWYCLVKDTDGVSKLEVLPATVAAQLHKDMRQQYIEAGKAWAAEKKEWETKKERGGYPVPPPARPSVRKLFRLSDNQDRNKRQKRPYEQKLEGVNVCLIRDHTGEQSAEIVPRTRMRVRQVELIRAYAEAVKAAEGGGKKIPRPSLRVVGRPRSQESAEKLLERIQKQLEQHRSREAAKGPAE
jgi:hypothetical protein